MNGNNEETVTRIEDDEAKTVLKNEKPTKTEEQCKNPSQFPIATT